MSMPGHATRDDSTRDRPCLDQPTTMPTTMPSENTAATSSPIARITHRRTRFRGLLAPPEVELVHAGLRGEWLIAGVRLLIVGALLYLPLQLYASESGSGMAVITLWVGVAALAEALVIYSAVRRAWGRHWIGFFSGVLDVTLVTLALWVLVMRGDPFGAVHDIVLFPAYLLAIGATSLRYDWRICALTGVAAISQYVALAAYTIWQWDLAGAHAPVGAHAFTWAAQVGRVALLAMATLLASAIVVRAREQQRVSTRDRLTGLANRGFFDDSLERIGAVAERTGEPVTIAMLDVDHFKRFNDTYGHLAGDDALRTLARILIRRFRSTDLLARYGGEEFVGLFPGMSAQDALRRLEELRKVVEAATIVVDGRGREAHMTISIGAAVWPHDSATLHDTLATADARLYRAKAEGRNQVCFL